MVLQKRKCVRFDINMFMCIDFDIILIKILLTIYNNFQQIITHNW